MPNTNERPGDPIPALRAAVARASHWRGDDSLEATEARLALREAVAEKYIRKLVAKAPPLTETQRERLALLLNPAGGGQWRRSAG
jgi:hypothetical protein